MTRDNESLRAIYGRALHHLGEHVAMVKGSPENDFSNEFIIMDFDEYLKRIQQLKKEWDQGGYPNNKELLCNALKSYKTHLENLKKKASEKLAYAVPDFKHLNDEIEFIEDGIHRVCNQ